MANVLKASRSPQCMAASRPPLTSRPQTTESRLTSNRGRSLMKLHYVLDRMRFGLCVTAILLNCFNIAFAQKPQTRYDKIISANLLKPSPQRPLSFEENLG